MADVRGHGRTMSGSRGEDIDVTAVAEDTGKEVNVSETGIKAP